MLLDLPDEAAVAAAYCTLRERMAAVAPTGDPPGRVLVQAMVPQGTELILGLTADQEFGQVVLVGLGGIFAEVLEDVAMRLPPFDFAEVRRMIGGLRGLPLLQGARGRAIADLDRLAGFLVALSDFAAANADLVAEMDINPLIVTADGFTVVDAAIVLRR